MVVSAAQKSRNGIPFLPIPLPFPIALPLERKGSSVRSGVEWGVSVGAWDVSLSAINGNVQT